MFGPLTGKTEKAGVSSRTPLSPARLPYKKARQVFGTGMRKEAINPANLSA